MAEEPGLQTQRRRIEERRNRGPRDGEVWMLVEQRWFQVWSEHVKEGDQNASTNPGPIDNSKLFADTETYKLKEQLMENVDYTLVPLEAWEELVSWYGKAPEQPAIDRKVIRLSSTKVEVYPVELTLCQYRNMDELETQSFSRASTIDTIHKHMRQAFQVPGEEETRLWVKNSDGSCERLRNLQSTVNNSCLCSGQTLIMESRNPDGMWPSSRPHNLRSSADDQDYYQGQPGVCGLSNLGNTCFMNSALQCLSSTPPLTDYFLTCGYLEELNLENPLGMQGEIAEAYADIIKQMWSGRHYSIIPRIFKMRVGHFAPQFSGYQQHDSQELLAFLLDGLHEDLNRVRQKEYVELRDAEGRPDQVVAAEAWENHRRRNDSIIVDIFHGLFKSTLICPQCTMISVTFDPFCYLSVPLPPSPDRVLEVFLVPWDPRKKPVQYRVVVPKAGKVHDLYLALAQLSGASPDKLIAADVFNHRFYKLFQPSDLLGSILDRDDIFVFEVTGGGEEEEDEEGEAVLPIYFREKSSREYGSSPFGHPLLLSIPRDRLSWDSLYQLLLHRLSRYVSSPDSEEEEEEETEEEDEEDEEVREEGEKEVYRTRANGLGGGDNCPVAPGPSSSGEQEVGEAASSSRVTGETESEGETGSGGRAPQSRTRRPLFTFQTVNANGTTECGNGNREEGVVPVSSQLYIAIDWDPKMKKKYYNEVEAEKYVKDRSMSSMPKRVTVRLKECISLFTTRETLEEENPWYCPACRKHQLATKKFDLWSLPEVLIIHLKRFSYTRFWREKLDTLVDFPLRDLDLSDFIINSDASISKYDLIAVSNHYGGLRDGHYTTIARNKDDRQWYYFDDSKVTFASEEHVVSSAAYVLFYQRQDRARQATPGPSAACPGPSSEPGGRSVEEIMELD